ncbi:hypothetical protein WJX82_002188 [Trebouxia sp. C0006]
MLPQESQEMQQTRQVSNQQADQRQHIDMADKQVQAGSRLDRVLKPRRNSQNSMVQSSTLQHSPSMRSMRPILGETTLNMLELSKIIKHLQAQLDHQEAVGAGLQGQFATALAELHCLQAVEANQREIIEQAHAEGVQVGRRELVQERHLKQRLEKMLDRKLTEQQAAADKEAAAAVQAAAHVASLEQFIQDLKSQNEATLKSKLKVDRRNADLQRRHDSLKENAQHTQHALASSQEQVAALEDRLHVLRRMNSQLERSESNAQQRTVNAQHQVKLVDEERKLLVTMLHDQAASAMGEPSALTPVPAASQTKLQRSISDHTALPGMLHHLLNDLSDTGHAETF